MSHSVIVTGANGNAQIKLNVLWKLEFVMEVVIV